VDVEALLEKTGAILTEFLLGPDVGMPTACVASFDDLRVIRTAHLVERLVEACGALRAAVVC
jgi:hypothetical protein